MCGGIFLDQASRQRVVAARCADAAAASDLASAHARWSPALDARIACPACGRPMTATRVAGDVDLDVCGDHGAWFDRDELRRFIDALSTQRPKRAGHEASRGVAGAAVVGTAVVGTAVAASVLSDANSATAQQATGLDGGEVLEAGATAFEVLFELLGALAD